MSFVNPVNKSFCLEKVCESNFQKLLKLIPDLPLFTEHHIGNSKMNAGLQITLITLSPYTMTIELNHCLNINEHKLLAPAIQVRIYFDMQIAEVLSDNDREIVQKIYKDKRLSHEIMQYKWELNYFLQKWLDHCLNKHNSLAVAA
ncbi:MAG: DUF1249 domain-containing protein [Methylococcales bacterium]|nr:DUF1249 domain-containing protein [Methylococcales bacterium]